MKKKLLKLVLASILACTAGMPHDSRAMDWNALPSVAIMAGIFSVIMLCKYICKAYPYSKANFIAHIIRQQDLESLALIVENDLNALNMQNEDDATPLMIAIDSGNTDIITFLVKKGADITIMDLWGQTALDYAQQKGLTKIATLIQNLQQFPDDDKKAYTLLREIWIGNNDHFAVPALKLLYKNKTYYINTTHTMALFEKYGKTKAFKNLIKECTFFKCSKEELEQLRKTGFPLDETEFDTQKQMATFKTTEYFDIKIIYEKNNKPTF